MAPLWLMLAAANSSAYAQASTPPSPADWTQYHRDNMQRWNPYETVLGVNNAVDLQLKWKNSIGRDNGGIQPIVTFANGVIYFGSDGSGLFALNAGSGALLWNYSTPDGAEIGAPAVANGVVYAGGGDNVYALNANTGANLWSYTTGGRVLSSPAVVNGVIYIGSNDHNVYALNAGTGARLWSFATGDTIEDSSPAVVDGVVYIGSSDHNVYALNAGSGTKLWSFATGNIVRSSPAVANGVVYLGSEDPQRVCSQCRQWRQAVILPHWRRGEFLGRRGERSGLY